MPAGRTSRLPVVARFAALLLLFSFALTAQPSTATSPCPPVYQVAYADSVWTVVLMGFARSPRPVTELWYWSPWNRTFEPVGSHIGRLPTTVERVTFMDRDRDRNVSFVDLLHVWDGNRSLTNFTIAFGASPSALDLRLGLHLEPGYTEPCGPSPPWWPYLFSGPLLLFTPPLFPFALGGILILLVALLIVLPRRARRRGRTRLPPGETLKPISR